MKKIEARANQRVRRLCRDIGLQADNRQHLQNLVIQLQEVLGRQAVKEARYRSGPIKRTAENPFDKIMVG
jgi:hypothetical protein